MSSITNATGSAAHRTGSRRVPHRAICPRVIVSTKFAQEENDQMEQDVNRPQPDARGVGKQYWASGQTGKLSLPKCESCGKVHWYPRLYCPHCSGDKFEWITCSGKGVIHTFTIVRQSGHKYFKSKVPYALAMVALEEGPLVMTNIIDCDVADVAIDKPVTVVFEKIADDIHAPLFRLAGQGK